MDRLHDIKNRIVALNTAFQRLSEKMQTVQDENNDLKEELDRLKKITFERKKQIEIAKMANQFQAETPDTTKLKRELDKYIREVDLVLDALKNQE